MHLLPLLLFALPHPFSSSPQLNYEALRRCVARGPVTPMPPEQWEKVLTLLSHQLLSHPLSSPLVPHLHTEVKTRYEDTIRKTNSKR